MSLSCLLVFVRLSVICASARGDCGVRVSVEPVTLSTNHGGRVLSGGTLWTGTLGVPPTAPLVAGAAAAAAAEPETEGPLSVPSGLVVKVTVSPFWGPLR